LIEDNGLNLHGDIEHFAALVIAAEREACAQVAERQLIGRTIAKAIRARGEE
jgi:acid stress-induced BolA-like protein IbaG/YrbA